ncbi:DUF6262 family protein [Streptomyces sp. NPDC056227]|uniref:DUF6262 family protein n=1 Tax=Streptomyces sp. NPDC056227 TaxID=3345753 RepID=UPI0035E22BD0
MLTGGSLPSGRAAQDKHQQAVQRAEAGIRRLTKESEEINFRTVACAAGVSLDFLYAHTDLRKRIETLRGQQWTENQSPPQAPSARIHRLDSRVIVSGSCRLCRG